jgi:hypothetical protein
MEFFFDPHDKGWKSSENNLKLMFPSTEEHHDCARPESLNLMLLSLAITSGSAREQRWSSIRFDWNLQRVSLTFGFKNWKPDTKKAHKLLHNEKGRRF